ncbi:phosphatidylinositol mannoside acyltransferase [Nocardioides caldifontis]|uniref:phosphatidylinositol mannoside acyltransferase n=1 Tax=Nocardioides caldifontis TaxID=2588938 RepID=UPI001EEFBCE4|nr:phosphatidylinositol mannoside acyltransferase [Nocardioides caldifontis]
MTRSARALLSAASEHAAAAGYVAGWRMVRLLPERRARALFDRLALRLHDRGGAGVQQLRANLRRVRPELDDTALDELTREGLRSYFRYWCESFRLPSWPIDDLVARTSTVHEERLREPFAEGRGVVVALPHQANWDWAGAWAGATGMPVMTVAERLRPEKLYDEFVAYRESLGMTILPLTGGKPPLPTLAAHLRDGGFVCLLADRDLRRTGVEVSLCGHPARIPSGAALLARETGAALVPINLAYVGDGMRITFHPEVVVEPGQEGVAKAMQQVADAFTEGLRAHPQDWHMMQKVFTEDLA